MGETPSRVQVRDLLVQVLEQFPESQRAQLKIEFANEELDAVLPARATVQSLAAPIQNALDATSEERPIVISARGTEDGLSIVVQDRGHGIPANVLRRIAEPFFTTKEPGKGMRLETFLVGTFAERLGGRVLFNSTPGEGTTVTLELPIHPSGPSAHASI